MKRVAMAVLNGCIIFLVGIQACSDSPAESESTPATPFISGPEFSYTTGSNSGNPMAYIGAMHNLAMHQLYRDLRKAARQKGAMLTQEEAIAVLEESLRKFFLTHGVGKLHSAEVWAWHGFLGARKTATARQLWDDISVMAEAQFSPAAEEYINQIAMLADQAEVYGLEWLRSHLQALEGAATLELSGWDLEGVYVTSSVTLSSAEYWPEYAEEWYAMCGTDIHCAGPGGGPFPGPGIERMSGWKVLGADAIGGAGGFLRGAWAGACIGAAVSSSIAVIMQL